MILVLGGIASGKRTYVRSLGYGDDQMDGDVRSGRPVLLGLEEVLRGGALDDAGMARVLGKEVVCCCEVGLGVVPLAREERAWRELVGRTCAQLAARADGVVQMACGIPVVLGRAEGAAEGDARCGSRPPTSARGDGEPA